MAKTPQRKGNAIIFNAASSVTFAALAAIVNATPSLAWRDVTDVQIHNDSTGVPRTWTKNFGCKEITIQLTPGVGAALADKAAVIAAVTALEKGTAVVIASADLPEVNCAAGDKAVIWDVGGRSGENQLGSFDVTIRKWVEFNTDGTTTALDFTGAWAAL